VVNVGVLACALRMTTKKGRQLSEENSALRGKSWLRRWSRNKFESVIRLPTHSIHELPVVWQSNSDLCLFYLFIYLFIMKLIHAVHRKKAKK